MLPVVQFLNNSVSYGFSLCFKCLRQKGKSDPCYPIMSRSRIFCSASSLKENFRYILELSINLINMRAI